MENKTKIVCINLKNCIDRRLRIETTLATSNLPFEFFEAIHYKDVKLTSNIENCEISTSDNDYKIKVDYNKSIEIYNQKTSLTHDPDAYLIDQVEHFARVHFSKYHHIPYADVVVTNHDDATKKWFTHKDKTMFVDIVNFRKYLTISEMACCLSHYHVLKQLISDPDYDAYIILEDDVILKETEDYTLIDMLKHLDLYSKCWDIAFLNDARFCSPNSLIHLTEYLNYGVYSSFTNACSYVVTKKSAQKLIDRFNGSINIAMDDFLSRQQDLKITRLKKPLFEIDFSLPSNIRVDEIEKKHQEYCDNFKSNL